jgi:hypothetical protein
MAEHALACCLSDPAQLSQITDTSLCHGSAGLFQTAWHATRDALNPEITACLPHLTDRLIQHGRPATDEEPGLLEGRAGLALALHTAANTMPPASGWDTCLLIS